MKRILVDTSVWIQFFKNKDSRLTHFLKEERILIHPLVTGELLLGNLKTDSKAYNLLISLEKAKEESYDEVIHFINDRNLSGSGIGWVDASLLVSCILSNSVLYTADTGLNRVIRNNFPEILV